MSVTIEGERVRLSGRCRAEDAETLLAALLEKPGLSVDIGGVQTLHLAVVQVLLAARPPVTGVPDSAFLAERVAHLFE